MNNVQKKFKKEMYNIEQKKLKEAKKGSGIFANKLYRLRFYGYNNEETKINNPILNFVKLIFKIFFKIIKIALIISILIILLSIALYLLKNKNT